jgi:hypothetical protein
MRTVKRRWFNLSFISFLVVRRKKGGDGDELPLGFFIKSFPGFGFLVNVFPAACR